MIESYPLQWPVGRPRTPGNRRQSARFYSTYERKAFSGTSTCKAKCEVTVYAAIMRLREQARMLGATELVCSTNMPTRNDGLPMSKAREPADPGVAVYCRIAGELRCFQCDKWNRLADNIAAVAAHLDAIRAVERYGVGTADQMFAGYKMLTAADAKTSWWTVLGYSNPPATVEAVKAKFIDRIREAHPDRGGNGNHAAELTAAMREAEVFYSAGGAS